MFWSRSRFLDVLESELKSENFKQVDSELESEIFEQVELELESEKISATLQLCLAMHYTFRII